MLIEPPSHPLRFDPSVEEPEKGEEEVGRSINETLLKISQTTFEDGGHALRSVHAKSHGIISGELIVDGDLPPVLAQGLFGKAATYPVVMRFSTSPGDILPDSISSPRGLAVKVIGVEGERLPGSEGDNTQDFVLVNGKVFNAPNGKVFAANLKLLAATTDKIEGVKKVVSAALRGIDQVIRSTTGEGNPTVEALGGQPETHILGDSFFSQGALRYGDYIAKVAIMPRSPELRSLTDQSLNLNKDPVALRTALNDYFAQNGGEWNVMVQLCTDLHHMPVENLTKEWPEDESPYLPVGRIVVQPQPAWSEARSAVGDDQIAFSPWHGLAAHQPLGSIMRLRKAAYEASVQFRGSHNGCPIHEPRSLEPLPS